MKNLNIGRKLIVCFGAIAVIVLCLAGVSMAALGSLNARADSMGLDMLPKVLLIDSMNTATSDFAVALHAQILATDPAHATQAEARIRETSDAVEEGYRKLRPTLTSKDSIAAAESFHTRWANYNSVATAILEVSRGSDDLGATQKLQDAQPEFDALSADLTKLSDIERQAGTATVAEAGSTYHVSLWLNVAALIMTLGMMAGVLGFLVKAIARPIDGVTAQLSALARGEPAIVTVDHERHDEVGRLSQAMALLSQQLDAAEAAKQEQTALICDTIGRSLADLSNGDLTTRIEADLVGPFAVLKVDFNAAMESLGRTLSAFADCSTHIRSGSSEINQASEDLSRRTEQQAASIEESSAALKGIAQTVGQTADGAARASEIVAATHKDAEHGGAVVRDAIEAMGRIERASSEIAQIIAVIDGIAFQTNLLALNAGVEAARAGAAGQGFAVVASEVRALAQRSADAANDVKARISASAQQVVAGVELVGQTGKALERIGAQVAEMNNLVASIAVAATQQAASLGEVSAAVTGMNEMTQQNAAMAEQSNAVAQNLVDQAEHLSDRVSQFRFDGAVVPFAARSAGRGRPVVARPAAARPAPRNMASGTAHRGSRGAALAATAPTEDWSDF